MWPIWYICVFILAGLLIIAMAIGFSIILVPAYQHCGPNSGSNNSNNSNNADTVPLIET